jgi:flagellar secretion chaperone FliS
MRAGGNVATGYQAYQTNAIHTAPPEQLVVMLYDGCLRFLRRAESAAESGDRPRVTEGVSRATAIIMELNATLDMDRGGEIAQNLRSLYFFLHRHLIDASREGSADKIRQAIALVAELRDAFAQAAKKVA